MIINFSVFRFLLQKPMFFYGLLTFQRCFSARMAPCSVSGNDLKQLVSAGLQGFLGISLDPQTIS